MIQVDLYFFQMGWSNHQLVFDVKYFPEKRTEFPLKLPMVGSRCIPYIVGSLLGNMLVFGACFVESFVYGGCQSPGLLKGTLWEV